MDTKKKKVLELLWRNKHNLGNKVKIPLAVSTVQRELKVKDARPLLDSMVRHSLIRYRGKNNVCCDLTPRGEGYIIGKGMAVPHKLIDKPKEKPKGKRMIYAKSWDEFRKAGMLWFVNRMLHLVGWAMVVDVDDKNKALN